MLFPFLAGGAVGFLLGVLAVGFAILAFWTHHHPFWTSSSTPGAAAPPGFTGPVRRASRLARYLDEHGGG